MRLEIRPARVVATTAWPASPSAKTADSPIYPSNLSMLAERYGEPRGLRLPYVNPWLISLARLLRRGAVWQGPSREKVLALTFDDGPSAEAMPSLLRELAAQGLHATFFILGDRLADLGTPASDARRQAVRDAVCAGHEIAFHGWTHRSLAGVPHEVIRREVRALRTRLAEVAGADTAERVRFFRPPFGRMTPRLRDLLAEEHLTPVNASIVPGDGYLPRGWAETPERTVPRVLRELHPGAILCLHVGENLGIDDQVFNIHHAAEILKQLVPRLQGQGYRAVPLGELLPTANPAAPSHDGSKPRWI